VAVTIIIVENRFDVLKEQERVSQQFCEMIVWPGVKIVLGKSERSERKVTVLKWKNSRAEHLFI